MPCRNNPLGVKGAGEAGAIGSCPAVMNAIVDALWRAYGIAPYRHACDPRAGLGGDRGAPSRRACRRLNASQCVTASVVHEIVNAAAAIAAAVRGISNYDRCLPLLAPCPGALTKGAIGLDRRTRGESMIMRTVLAAAALRSASPPWWRKAIRSPPARRLMKAEWRTRAAIAHEHDRRQAAIRSSAKAQAGLRDLSEAGAKISPPVPRQLQDRRHRGAAGDLGEQGRLRRQAAPSSAADAKARRRQGQGPRRASRRRYPASQQECGGCHQPYRKRRS